MQWELAEGQGILLRACNLVDECRAQRHMMEFFRNLLGVSHSWQVEVPASVAGMETLVEFRG